MDFPMVFTPPNLRAHYWRADDGRIFSSAKKAIVPETDADFVAWSEGGSVPTLWPRDDADAQTDDALRSALALCGVTIPKTFSSTPAKA